MLTLTAGMPRHAGTSAAEDAGGAAIKRYLGYECGLCNMIAATIKNLIEHPYNVSVNINGFPPVFPAFPVQEIDRELIH